MNKQDCCKLNIIAVVTLCLTSCYSNVGGTNKTDQSSVNNLYAKTDIPKYCQYVYINHNRTNDIKAFGVNKTNGDLEPLNLPLVPTGNNPGSFYTHPNGKFVYVLAGADNAITAYKIDQSTGRLTVIQSVTSPGTMLWGGTLTPKSGAFLYACNNVSNNITMYKIDPVSGLLSLNKTAKHPNGLVENAINGIGPNSIKITANLKWAYVGNYTSNNITLYHYDANTGDLTLYKNEAIDVPGCIQARQLALSPAAVPSDPLYVPPPKQLYVLCQGSNDIAQLNLDSDQLLIPSKNISMVSTNGVSPTSMSIEANYKYIYSPNMQSNNIAEFSIESTTGHLKPLTPSVVSGGVEGKGIYTNMGYAYVTNFGPNSVSKFKIGDDGVLTKVGSDIPTGGVNPGNITFTPFAKECK